MTDRNSIVILCKNIKMDKDYKNVLSYNTNELLTLCETNKVYKDNTFSYIRESEVLKIDCPIATCMQANYVAFQNPYYNNKWFYGFIDKVVYRNNGVSYVYFTLDVWSTFYEDWNLKECYVIREHVSDDTIGLHTLPEPLEKGDYVSNDGDGIGETYLNNPTDFFICMGVTELPDESIPNYENNRVYNGIFGGLYYLGFTKPSDCQTAIRMYDRKAKSGAIVSLFMAPRDLSSFKDATEVIWKMPAEGECTVSYLKETQTAEVIPNFNGEIRPAIIVKRPSKLGIGYTPKNNKLLTYPYMYFNLTNNSGSTVPFRYEDFTNPDSIKFNVYASLCPGMSMKAVPRNYKNLPFTLNYGITLPKTPVCSWNSDVYLNWLTQNGVNVATDLVKDLSSYGTNLSKGNISDTMSASAGILGTMNEMYQADLVPNQARGNTNSGDVNFSNSNDGGLTLTYMSIKDEYAKLIDDYFTRFGYLVNTLKKPSITSRPIFNYIEIGPDEEIGFGSIPKDYMNEINNIARSGVTIWHNHANVGNYSLDNKPQ